VDAFAAELAKQRILFVGSGINEEAAERLVAALLLLNAMDPASPIELYINSAGGNVVDGLAIYDTMQLIEAPVATYCLGCAASMGAVLLASGRRGMRYATPNARIMVHQVSTGGGLSGPPDRAHLMYSVMRSLNRTVGEILARHTGRPLRRVLADMRRTRWFTAREAVEYGLVDHVLEPGGPRPRGAG
jgi:ATP-dependent Clp protease protease subunit